MNWHDYYEYSNGDLYRKNHRVSSYNGVKAGYIDLRGYVRTKLFSKMTFAHRVIWEMHNGEVPKGMEIDHINGVKHDNRIENLRCVDRWVNCKNAAMRKDNTSGVTGVYFINKIKRDGKPWLVQIQIDKNRVYKTFYTKEEAVSYAKSVYEGNPEFTERHGK
ncbi:homing endonuclease [Escherichia phage BEK1-1]|nr:homing endonuclease [Escherichia phage BEK1-1]